MKYILIFIITTFSFYLIGQDSLGFESQDYQKMKWFDEAKLGIFIHWGIYAVDGVSESWSFFNGDISHEDYLKQLNEFDASDYRPDHWVDLIQKSGAKYSVITSRHHDGFALWNTKYGNLNAVEHASVKKDVLSPFIIELKKAGIKTGLYYSLPDWSHPEYTNHTKKIKRYIIKDEPERWAKYQSYYMGQLAELKLAYDPDLWWFDGDWEHNAAEWDVNAIKSFLTINRSEVIFNSRLNEQGDYSTPEIGLPVRRPSSRYWELCMTMNDSWGNQPKDRHYKSPQQVMDVFVDCLSKGGNLLLDIGPMANGQIPPKQVKILEELGRWTQKHEKAIYETIGGIPYDYYYGPNSLSKDSTSLFLYVRDIPRDGKISLKGISNKIKKISVIGSGNTLDFDLISHLWWSSYPGILYIDLPLSEMDENYTVIAIELEGAIELYID
jgi:alpha-L-fucosidase